MVRGHLQQDQIYEQCLFTVVDEMRMNPLTPFRKNKLEHVFNSYWISWHGMLLHSQSSPVGLLSFQKHISLWPGILPE